MTLYESNPLKGYTVEASYSGNTFETVVTGSLGYAARYQLEYKFDDRSIAPSELTTIIEHTDFGVWQGGIDVEKSHRRRGIGEAIWVTGDTKLSDHIPVLVRYVKDDSMKNWTSRHIKNVLARLAETGRDVEMLWEGKVGGNNAFLYIIRNL